MLKLAFLFICFIWSFSCESWGVGDYLHVVDDSIVRWMKDPGTQKKKEIFDMVADYLETLQTFIDRIDLKKKTALQPGETLLKRKQPRYFEEPFPEENLKTHYNWTDVDTDKFKKILSNTYLLWQDFEKSYNDLKTYLETNQDLESGE